MRTRRASRAPAPRRPRARSRRAAAPSPRPSRARARPRGRVRARDAAGDDPQARRAARRRARARSSSASTSRSRRRSARCASSTPRATRSRPARPSTPAAAARRSRSSSSPASATAATRRPTASSPPTGTRSPPASSSPSAIRPRPPSRWRRCWPTAAPARSTNTALAFARGFQYAAIALGLGTLIFFLYCWRGASTRLHAPARAAAARRRARRLRLRGRRRDPAGRRRPGRHVLGGGQARRGERGARHPLRPRLGHRRRGLARRARRARAAPAAGGGAPANFAPGGSEGTPGCAGMRPRWRERRRRAGAVLVGPRARRGEPRRRRGRRAPARPRRRPRPLAAARPALTPKLLALAVPLVALALLPSLGGHTSVQKPVAILLPSNILHVLAMSAWLGGHRRARVRAAHGHLGARARASGRRCWRARSRASPRWPRSRCRC